MAAGSGANLLELKNLGIDLRSGQTEVSVARGVSFALKAGERVGLVGESGSGKTVTALSILRLLPVASSRVGGQVLFDGRDLLRVSEKEIRRVRGGQIGMIFQEPMSALDPVFTIGEQISETIRLHLGLSRRQAHQRSIDLLNRVGIAQPARRYHEYAHQLSGGMRQRAMIAMALSCEPKLLIADEPTTALDVTIQAQIIDLLLDLSETSGTALLFISHDLGVVAETCTRLLTMYAGEVVEDGRIDDVLIRPRHPYTSGLLRSLPPLARRGSAFHSIPGRMPSPTEMPAGCRFHTRCSHAELRCLEEQSLLRAGDRHSARCWRWGELELSGALG
jgi:peptide/nickel transport system ATP-binding protein